MLDVLAITGPIFLIIAAGFASVRTGLFGKADIRVLGAFVINVSLPAVLFSALSRRPISEVVDPGYLAAYAAGSLVPLLAGILVARYALRQGLQTSALTGMGMALSNSLFVGFPLATQLAGSSAVLGLTLTVLVENLLILPIVLTLAEHGAQSGAHVGAILRQTFKRLLRNPIILAITAGFASSVSGLHPPEVLSRAIDLLALASAPVSLFVIGGSLLGQRISHMAGDVALIAGGKLILHPLAVGAAFLLLPGIDPELKLAALIFASAPMLAIYPLIGQRYGQENLCTAALVITTVASFFTLSGLVALVRLLH